MPNKNQALRMVKQFVTPANYIRSTWYSDIYRADMVIGRDSGIWDLHYIRIPFEQEKEKAAMQRFHLSKEQLPQFYNELLNCLKTEMDISRYIQDKAKKAESNSLATLSKSCIDIRHAIGGLSEDGKIREIIFITKPCQTLLDAGMVSEDSSILLSDLLKISVRIYQTMNKLNDIGIHLGAIDLDDIVLTIPTHENEQPFIVVNNLFYATMPDKPYLKSQPLFMPQNAWFGLAKNGNIPTLETDIFSLSAFIWTITDGRHWDNEPNFEARPAYLPDTLVQPVWDGFKLQEEYAPQLNRILNRYLSNIRKGKINNFTVPSAIYAAQPTVSEEPAEATVINDGTQADTEDKQEENTKAAVTVETNTGADTLEEEIPTVNESEYADDDKAKDEITDYTETDTSDETVSEAMPATEEGTPETDISVQEEREQNACEALLLEDESVCETPEVVRDDEPVCETPEATVLERKTPDTHETGEENQEAPETSKQSQNTPDVQEAGVSEVFEESDKPEVDDTYLPEQATTEEHNSNNNVEIPSSPSLPDISVQENTETEDNAVAENNNSDNESDNKEMSGTEEADTVEFSELEETNVEETTDPNDEFDEINHRVGAEGEFANAISASPENIQEEDASCEPVFADDANDTQHEANEKVEEPVSCEAEELTKTDGDDSCEAADSNEAATCEADEPIFTDGGKAEKGIEDLDTEHKQEKQQEQQNMNPHKQREESPWLCKRCNTVCRSLFCPICNNSRIDNARGQNRENILRPVSANDLVARLIKQKQEELTKREAIKKMTEKKSVKSGKNPFTFVSDGPAKIVVPEIKEEEVKQKKEEEKEKIPAETDPFAFINDEVFFSFGSIELN